MKKLLTHVALVFLTVCLVIGCGRHHYPQSLLTADSLAEVRPDSSLKMLEAMAGEMATAPETDQMYYRLLRIKASDKCDRLQPDTFEITQIVDYYEQAGDSLLPAAYYYAGRTYYDLHDMPQALGYYQKAVDAICDRQTRPYLLLKEVCYSQMGYIFMYQKLYHEGMTAFKEGIQCADLINDSTGQAYNYRDLGTAYEGHERYDSALVSYKRALSYAMGISDESLELSVKSYMANCFRHLEMHDSALAYIRPLLSRLDIVEASPVYSITANIYYDRGERDSAIHYFHKLESVGGVYAKENAYKHLLNDAIRNKDLAKASYYLKAFCQYTDSVKRITQTNEVSRALLNYRYRKEIEERQKIKMGIYLKVASVIALFIIILLVLVAFYFFYRSRKSNREIKAERYRNLERNKVERYKHSATYIEENKARIAAIEELLKNTESDQSTMLSLEQEKLFLTSSNILANIEKSKEAETVARIHESDIYNRLSNLEKAPDDKDWQELESLLNAEYSHFCDRLKVLHDLSLKKYHACLLIKVGIDPTQIAVLLNTSKQNVTSIRSRLFMEVFGRKGCAKDWDDYIKSL